MDEYSPKRHDIAQLRFLCETLYHDCLANLEEQPWLGQRPDVGCQSPVK